MKSSTSFIRRTWATFDQSGGCIPSFTITSTFKHAAHGQNSPVCGGLATKIFVVINKNRPCAGSGDKDFGRVIHKFSSPGRHTRTIFVAYDSNFSSQTTKVAGVQRALMSLILSDGFVCSTRQVSFAVTHSIIVQLSSFICRHPLNHRSGAMLYDNDPVRPTSVGIRLW